MLTVTPTPEPTVVREFTGDSLWGLFAVTHLHGTPEVVADGPQSFVVEARGDSYNRVHFHVVDQYQVFLGGRGRVGRARFLPALVHYADAFTPYGPIESGPDGYVYVTLRPTGDPGARYMPESRAERARVDGRHHTMALLDRADAPPVEVVIPVEDDGLGACRLRAAAAGDALLPPPQPNPGGAHLLVIAGGVAVDGVDGEPGRLGRLGDVWVPAGEPWPTLRATEPGTDVLALGFPRPSPPTPPL